MRLFAQKIKQSINGKCAVNVYKCVSSTNLLARENAANYVEDTLFVANHQTNGRGRLGRSFYSPDSSGIYMSLLLKVKNSDILKITPVAAVAAAESIEAVSGKYAGIKWVNDIYINGKKVCGILCETVGNNPTSPDFVVLGVGINLFTPKNDFPQDIKDIAGTVFDEPCFREEKIKIISEFINRFYALYEKNNLEYLAEYRRRSILTGKYIEYVKDNEIYGGTVIDINDNANLIIKDQNGNILTLSSGEVSIGAARKK